MAGNVGNPPRRLTARQLAVVEVAIGDSIARAFEPLIERLEKVVREVVAERKAAAERKAG